MKPVSFTLNQYDRDGDMWDDCILLYIGDRTIIRLKNMGELDELIADLQLVKTEITDNDL